MARKPIPTWFFALVVVRLGNRFLVVRERRHGQRWYLPAGRVEPGERMVDAAVRETREESGIEVDLDGILKVEHTLVPGGAARLRVVFLAHPRGDTTPKSTPDEESLGAAWVTLEELRSLPVRGEEAREWCRAVAAGAPVYPLAALSTEEPD